MIHKDEQSVNIGPSTAAMARAENLAPSNPTSTCSATSGSSRDSIAVQKYADLSIVREAAQRLKGL